MKRRSRRFWLWLAVLALVASALLRPTLTLPHRVHRYLFVFDITQSMNTRDYQIPGLPPGRLALAKAVAERALAELPCGSEVGLALYTHKNVHVLLTPLEVCRHGPALRDALHAIDWRSAWAGDSYIAYGLFDAIKNAATLNTSLVFLSDGQQIPTTAREPAFQGHPGRVKGWIVGVGDSKPAPIPRVDMDGRFQGYWLISDLPRYRHSPRFLHQTVKRDSGLLLSHLDETRLRHLAAVTGLGYHRLADPERFIQTLQSPATGQRREVTLDLRPWLGTAALALALLGLV